MKLLCRIETQANRILWGESLAAVKPWRRRLVNTARIVYAIGRDLSEGQLTLRAMNLVYTTLLSLLPLIALSFSVLKGFGVQNQVRPVLLALLEPVGEKGFVITEQVIDFVITAFTGCKPACIDTGALQIQVLNCRRPCSGPI